MASMLQINPSDARATPFVQPDWNSASGNGVSVPADRNESRSLEDIYASQRAGAKILAGQTPAAPTVSTVTPSSGPAAGGTVVEIVGTNFHAATGVTFGGTAGTSLRVLSTTRIRVTTPAKAAGAHNVVVTTPGGTGSKSGGFTTS